MSLKLLWYSPKVEFKGKGIIEAWGEEMARQGWEIVQEPPCDLVFFGSDSQLREDLLGKFPTICYFWGWDPARLLDTGFRLWAQGQLKIISRCTRVLVPGPITAYQLADWGIPGQICIPGIDTATLALPAVAPERRNRVVFLSRLAPHKGLEVLIEAIACLQPPPELLICGPGDRTPFQLFADSLGVKVEFREIEDAEKTKTLMESAVLVHPSRYEGFGMPPLEAMACGTPVMVSDIPQHLWLLKEHAWYFQDADDLAQGLAQVLSNPGPALKAAAQGQAWVRQEMTLEKAAQRLWPHIHQTIKEFWARVIRDEPGRWQEAYDAEHRRNWAYSVERLDPSWFRHWRAQYVKREVIGPEVLDIGAAAGTYTIMLAKEGHHVTWLDISPEAQRQAKDLCEKFGVADQVEFRLGDAQALPLPDGAFDSVWAGEILEHVPDPATLITEALRVLRPGGKLILSTPIGGHHYDPFHIGPDGGGWDELTLKRLLAPWAAQVKKMEQIAEEGTEPSCYLIVLEKIEQIAEQGPPCDFSCAFCGSSNMTQEASNSPDFRCLDCGRLTTPVE